MSYRPFSDLPDPVKKLLAGQIQTTIHLHDASGIPMLECRQMVLRGGGTQDLKECVERCREEGLL